TELSETPLAVRGQLGGAEWADAHDLVDLPLEQLEGAAARRGVGIAAGNALRFLWRIGADQVHPDLSVRRGAGQDDLAGVVLLLHPDEMLVERDRPLVAGLRGMPLRQEPHTLLLLIELPQRACFKSRGFAEWPGRPPRYVASTECPRTGPAVPCRPCESD